VYNAVNDPAPTVRQYLGTYGRLKGEPRWLFLPVGPLRLLMRMIALAAVGGRAADLPDILTFAHRCARFSMDRAREQLGWEPRVGVEEGVAACAPWLREQGLL
jgi:nucleoside-diphosphate-sugar epimerase